MIFYGGTISIPNSYDIYCVLIVELLEKLISLELSNTNTNTNSNEIKSTLKLLEYFFEDERNRDFINNELPVDSNGHLCSFKNPNIANYLNPLVIFLTNFNTNRIKYNIINIWEKNGGIYNSVFENIYSIKKELVFLTNELEKNLASIDKNNIKKYLSDKNPNLKPTYIDSFLYKLLSNELKIKLHTFQVYTIIKNNFNISDKNKIHHIDKNEFIKMDYYFKLGIDFNLLKTKEINRIYNTYQTYWEQIPNSELNPYIIIEYENCLWLQNINSQIIKKKMQIINIKYHEYIFNLYLSNLSEYSDKIDEIIVLYDYLTENDYKFTKEQQDKINLLIDKILINHTIPYEFKLNLFEPIISPDELISLKNKILTNINNLCEIIKNIFPHYNISPDINKYINNINKNSNQETTDKITYFYCVIILIIGYINWKLVKYKQDYIIITKGGKALQFLLSKLSKSSMSNTNIKINSSDIDLLICPTNPNNISNPEKNRYLGIIICLLIQWILNPTNNIYSKHYNISWKLPEITDPYPYIIKLSYKQNLDNESNPKYIAISDIDYGVIIYKEFYSKLIYDQINNNELFPNLLYVYQNLSDFILEKIYYIHQNYKLLQQFDNLEQHKNFITNEIDSIGISITNYNKQLINLMAQIKTNNKLIKNNNEKIDILSKQLEHITSLQHNLILQKQTNQINNQINVLTDEVNNLMFFNDSNKKVVNKLQNKISNCETDINELNISLRLIIDDINKKISNTNNYIRFINKFLEQIKITIKIIYENTPDDNNQSQSSRAFIKKIIDENNDFLKFNENDYTHIINLIFD